MTTADGADDVLVEWGEDCTLVRFNRAHRANSISAPMMEGLLRAAELTDASGGARALVTIGEGSVYCAGGDRDTLTGHTADGAGMDLTGLGHEGVSGGEWGMPALGAEGRRADPLGFGRWVTRFLDVGTPTIAALNGGAAGGGLSLALLHDIRIASRRAKLVPAFVGLGASPEMGLSWLLPRIVGLPKAYDLLTRVRPIPAEEALELGLVEQVVEPEDLLDAARARAAELARLPPVALRMVKRLLRRSLESTLDAQLEREWANQTRLLGSGDVGATIRDYLGRLS